MNAPTPEAPDENQIIAERRAKLGEIRAAGGVAFPNDFVPTHKDGRAARDERRA